VWVKLFGLQMLGSRQHMMGQLCCVAVSWPCSGTAALLVPSPFRYVYCCAMHAQLNCLELTKPELWDGCAEYAHVVQDFESLGMWLLS
jgi:hypothetical protein